MGPHTQDHRCPKLPGLPDALHRSCYGPGKFRGSIARGAGGRHVIALDLHPVPAGSQGFDQQLVPVKLGLGHRQVSSAGFGFSATKPGVVYTKKQELFIKCLYYFIHFSLFFNCTQRQKTTEIPQENRSLFPAGTLLLQKKKICDAI